MDSMGNAVAIAHDRPVPTMYTGGIINPFDAMDQIAIAGMKGGPKMGNLASPDRSHSRIDLGNGRILEVIPAPIRMLAAFWSYDSGTKTLFRPRIDNAEVATELQSFAHFVEARYWWLRGSHTQMLIDSLRKVFDEHDIERIAPIHGCVIEGRAAVARHRDLMFDMLAAFDFKRKAL
jgi:hypothetical protein